PHGPDHTALSDNASPCGLCLIVGQPPRCYKPPMLTYTSLKDRPRDFLAATGLRHEEFARLLPAFATAYTARYPLEKTLEGEVLRRRLGVGAPRLPRSSPADTGPYRRWQMQAANGQILRASVRSQPENLGVCLLSLYRLA